MILLAFEAGSVFLEQSGLIMINLAQIPTQLDMKYKFALFVMLLGQKAMECVCQSIGLVITFSHHTCWNKSFSTLSLLERLQGTGLTFATSHCEKATGMAGSVTEKTANPDITAMLQKEK